MSNHRIQLTLTTWLLLALAAGLSGCELFGQPEPPTEATPTVVESAAVASPESTPQPEATYSIPVLPANGKTRIGVSFSDFTSERWKNEAQLMQTLLEEQGYEVITLEANQDAQLQNAQIDAMLAQGVRVLIIAAQNGKAVVRSVHKATQAGVKVIAYDGLIPSPDITVFLSFSNIQVGQMQVKGVLQALNIDSWDSAAKGPAKLVRLSDRLVDKDTLLLRQGQDEILQPYIDKGTISVVADVNVENGDMTKARETMDSILNQNKVDAIVAASDPIALGAIQSLSAHKLTRVVPVSGGDVSADGCNSILKDELTFSILKDFRFLPPLAVDIVDKLLKGEPVPDVKSYPLAQLTQDPTQSSVAPVLFLPLTEVTKANVSSLVQSGLLNYDDVYRDIPQDQRPPKH